MSVVVVTWIVGLLGFVAGASWAGMRQQRSDAAGRPCSLGGEVVGVQVPLAAGGGANVQVCGSPRSGRIALRVTKPSGRTLAVPLDLYACAALARVLRNCTRVLAAAQDQQDERNMEVEP